MAKVVLIRHAAVVPKPDLATQQWTLSIGGKAAATRLGYHPFLTDVQFFASGDEPKMIETAIAGAQGRPVVTHPGFRELNRDAVGWVSSQDEYLDLVRRILSHPHESIRGCESAESAQRRVVTAINEVFEEGPDQMFAVVSGGLTLTLYLSHLQGKKVPDFAFWKRIRFPDLAVVETGGRKVVHGFGSATEI
jgi:broad specificity phosphatase PhoE